MSKTSGELRRSQVIATCVLAAGCDAGIRYEERLEQDMVALPIGPRVQRMATGFAGPCQCVCTKLTGIL